MIVSLVSSLHFFYLQCFFLTQAKRKQTLNQKTKKETKTMNLLGPDPDSDSGSDHVISPDEDHGLVVFPRPPPPPLGAGLAGAAAVALARREERRLLLVGVAPEDQQRALRNARVRRHRENQRRMERLGVGPVVPNNAGDGVVRILDPAAAAAAVALARREERRLLLVGVAPEDQQRVLRNAQVRRYRENLAAQGVNRHAEHGARDQHGRHAQLRQQTLDRRMERLRVGPLELAELDRQRNARNQLRADAVARNEDNANNNPMMMPGPARPPAPNNVGDGAVIRILDPAAAAAAAAVPPRQRDALDLPLGRHNRLLNARKLDQPQKRQEAAAAFNAPLPAMVNNANDPAFHNTKRERFWLSTCPPPAPAPMPQKPSQEEADEIAKQFHNVTHGAVPGTCGWCAERFFMPGDNPRCRFVCVDDTRLVPAPPVITKKGKVSSNRANVPEQFRERHSVKGYIKALVRNYPEHDGDFFPVCPSCCEAINKNKADKVWQTAYDFGRIPPQLSGLTEAEKMFVAQGHVFQTIVKVNNSGDVNSYKATGHSISFPQEPQKIFGQNARRVLPARTDLESFVAVHFIGPRGHLTNILDQLCKGPLKVDAEKLRLGFEHLKDSHVDYAGMHIQMQNLEAHINESIAAIRQNAMVTEPTPAQRAAAAAAGVAGPPPLPVGRVPRNPPAPPPPDARDAAAEPDDNDNMMMMMMDHPRRPRAVDAAADRAAAAAGGRGPLPAVAGVAAQLEGADLIEGVGEEILMEGGFCLDPTPAPIGTEETAAMWYLRQDSNPFIEFGGLDLIINRCFPHLFPTANFPCEFLPEVKLTRHMMFYYDSRFELDQNFILFLDNLRVRHNVCRNNARVKAGDAAEIAEHLRDENFKLDLQGGMEAKRQGLPTTAAQTAAIEYVRTHLRFTTKSIAFTEGDRAQGIYQLQNLTRCLGLPTFFITITPTAIDSHFGFQLALKANARADPAFADRADDPVASFTYEDRARCVFATPASSAIFYEFFITKFIEILLGYNLDTRASRTAHERVEGILGKVMEFYGCTEAQARSCLHFHLQLWTQFSPHHMTELARTGQLKEVLEFVTETVLSTMDEEYFKEREKIWADKDFVPAPGIELPEDPTLQLNWTIGRYQMHYTHKPTCAKGERRDRQGNAKCRLAFCRPASDSARMLLLIGPVTKLNHKSTTIELSNEARRPQANNNNNNPRRILNAADYLPCQHHADCVCDRVVYVPEPPVLIQELRPHTYGTATSTTAVDANGNACTVTLPRAQALAETNKLLARACLCNTNVALITCAAAAMAALGYLIKYMCKGDGVNVSIPVVLQALINMSQEERVVAIAVAQAAAAQALLDDDDAAVGAVGAVAAGAAGAAGAVAPPLLLVNANANANANANDSDDPDDPENQPFIPLLLQPPQPRRPGVIVHGDRAPAPVAVPRERINANRSMLNRVAMASSRSRETQVTTAAFALMGCTRYRTGATFRQVNPWPMINAHREAIGIAPIANANNRDDNSDAGSEESGGRGGGGGGAGAGAGDSDGAESDDDDGEEEERHRQFFPHAGNAAPDDDGDDDDDVLDFGDEPMLQDADDLENNGAGARPMDPFDDGEVELVVELRDGDERVLHQSNPFVDYQERPHEMEEMNVLEFRCIAEEERKKNKPAGGGGRGGAGGGRGGRGVGGGGRGGRGEDAAEENNNDDDNDEDQDSSSSSSSSSSFSPDDDDDDDGDGDDVQGAAGANNQQQQPQLQAGRIANPRYEYLEGHPRRHLVQLKLRSKYPYISLAGSRPPRLPRNINSNTPQSIIMKKTWASYWRLLARPWRRNEEWISGEDSTFEKMHEWVNLKCVDANDLPGRAAACYVIRCTWMLATSALNKRLYATYRFAWADEIGRNHVFRNQGGLGDEPTEEEDAERVGLGMFVLTVNTLNDPNNPAVIKYHRQKALITQKYENVFGIAEAVNPPTLEDAPPVRPPLLQPQQPAPRVVGGYTFDRDPVATRKAVRAVADYVPPLPQIILDDHARMMMGGNDDDDDDNVLGEDAAAARLPRGARVYPADCSGNANYRHLNNEQKLFVDQVFRTVVANIKGEEPAVNNGNLFWLEGAAGCGKTFATRILIEEIRKLPGESLNSVLTCAFQGNAACNLEMGAVTLHRAFSLASREAKGGPSVNDPKVLREIYGGHILKFIVTDEVSVVSAEVLGDLDTQLRKVFNANLPFGGIVFLAIGDFLQIPPTTGTSLPEATLHYISGALNGAGDLQRQYRGAAIWSKVFRIRLTKIERTDDCPIQTARLEEMRRSLRFSRNIYNGIKILQRSDVHGTGLPGAPPGPWSSARSLHTTNAARHTAGELHLQREAGLRRTFMFKWRLGLPDSFVRNGLSAAAIAVFYDITPDAWGYFVEGVPFMSLSNINTAIGLTNGAVGTAHSLIFALEHQRAVENAIRGAAAKGCWEVVLPPNIRPTHMKVAFDIPANIREALQDPDQAPNVPGEIINDKWVIPFGEKSLDAIKLPIKVTNNNGQVQNAQSKIKMNGFELTQALAITFHKAQGLTLNRVLLDLSMLAFYIITWEMLYVGFSRAPTDDDLRRMAPASENAENYLFKLRPKKATVTYLDSNYWVDNAGVRLRHPVAVVAGGGGNKVPVVPVAPGKNKNKMKAPAPAAGANNNNNNNNNLLPRPALLGVAAAGGAGAGAGAVLRAPPPPRGRGGRDPGRNNINNNNNVNNQVDAAPVAVAPVPRPAAAAAANNRRGRVAAAAVVPRPPAAIPVPNVAPNRNVNANVNNLNVPVVGDFDSDDDIPFAAFPYPLVNQQQNQQQVGGKKIALAPVNNAPPPQQQRVDDDDDIPFANIFAPRANLRDAKMNEANTAGAKKAVLVTAPAAALVPANRQRGKGFADAAAVAGRGGGGGGRGGARTPAAVPGGSGRGGGARQVGNAPRRPRRDGLVQIEGLNDNDDEDLF